LARQRNAVAVLGHALGLGVEHRFDRIEFGFDLAASGVEGRDAARDFLRDCTL